MTPPAHHDELALNLAERIEDIYFPVLLQPHYKRLSAVHVILVEAFAKIEAAERERLIKLVRTFLNPELDVGYNGACKDIIHALELSRALKDSKP